MISWLPPDPHGGLLPLMVVVVFGTLANVCHLTLSPVLIFLIEWAFRIVRAIV